MLKVLAVAMCISTFSAGLECDLVLSNVKYETLKACEDVKADQIEVLDTARMRYYPTAKFAAHGYCVDEEFISAENKEVFDKWLAKARDDVERQLGERKM